jgi:hypothetical protein
MRLTRRLIGALVVGTVFGLLALPMGAAGAGATHSVETFSEPTSWFGPDECSNTTITGTGTQSGTSYITETDNGSVHVRTDIQGSVDLYQANGPGPWDPQPGAFIGHWDYTTSISDQAPPSGAGSTTGKSSGTLTFPDGSTAKRQLIFHLTWDTAGNPLKLFFVKFVCAGA